MAAGRLAGRVAIVTGASSGIGRAISLKFAAAGARVVCSDLRPDTKPSSPDREPPTPTHELIQQRHGDQNAMFVECDVGSEESIKQLVKQAAKDFGRLDIMCNNAGIAREAASGLTRRIHETPIEDFDITLSINLRGVWLGCKHAIAQMLEQEPRAANERGDRTRGWIVNTASMLGLIAFPNAVCYVPAKHGVVGITRQVALDYARDRIHCNAICPGFIDTPMIASMTGVGAEEQATQLKAAHPWGALGRAEDTADAALFLVSDEASWITGHPLVVDGGYTIQ